MNCDHARNLFNRHLDGELSPSLETELAAHRLHCSQCRHELALMEVAGHVIAADTDGSESLDRGFTDRLLACIETQPASGVRMWSRRRWIRGAGLAAAAAIILTVWMVQPRPQVAGVIHDMPVLTAEQPDVQNDPAEFGQTADTLVKQVEDTWTTRADSAQSLIQLSRLSLQQFLDQFPAEEPQREAETTGPTQPGSFDELAPSVDGEDDIEDL
ncbi:MAG: hypothetical protein V3W34_10510 [Phycisphaerae bacterium]